MSGKKPQPHAELSGREHEVAKLVIEGHSNKVIAARLSISTHTAKFHVMNFIVKMNAQTRVDAAVKYALASRRSTGITVEQEALFGAVS